MPLSQICQCLLSADVTACCLCPSDAGEEDEQLQEFLQVMQPRRKTAIWSNDAEAGLQARGQSGAQQQVQENH